MSASVITHRLTFLDDPAATVDKNVRLGGGDETVTQFYNGWKLQLAATDEAELVVVDWGDELIFDIDKLRKVTFRASVSAIPSGVNAYIGLAAAHNATVDSIAQRILYQFEGSSNATVRTDDNGGHDTGDVWTPFSVNGTEQDFTIDLASGVETLVPNHMSRTGKGAVKFFSERNGTGIRMLQKTGMRMDGYVGGLQPYIRIDKASGTAVGSIVIHYIDFELES